MSLIIKHSSSLILFLTCIYIVFSSIAADAHNITAILSRHPDFSTFNELLSKAHLAIEINRRKTITVLAVSNDKIGDLAGKDLDIMKSIMMTHIVLDYYDVLKLQKMKAGSNILTTLYQTTGVASYGQGFLNVTSRIGQNIVFGSAVKGATHDCEYLATVAAQPYNISVLSVSHPLVTPGLDGQAIQPVAPSPKPVVEAEAPTSTEDVAESPVESADSPASADAPADEAAAAPADAPADAETPADAPANAPSPVEAPAADADNAAAKAPTSSAGKQLVSFSVGFIVVLGTLVMV